MRAIGVIRPTPFDHVPDRDSIAQMGVFGNRKRQRRCGLKRGAPPTAEAGGLPRLKASLCVLKSDMCQLWYAFPCVQLFPVRKSHLERHISTAGNRLSFPYVIDGFHSPVASFRRWTIGNRQSAHLQLSLSIMCGTATETVRS
jgi:hypothetical protein